MKKIQKKLEKKEKKLKDKQLKKYGREVSKSIASVVEPLYLGNETTQQDDNESTRVENHTKKRKASGEIDGDNHVRRNPRLDNVQITSTSDDVPSTSADVPCTSREANANIDVQSIDQLKRSTRRENGYNLRRKPGVRRLLFFYI